MPDLLTIAFIVVAALGLALFWRGWRGRRIDDHPWCRKCRFDLFGAAAGSTRCPECGANLDDAKAVRIGRLRRRPVMIASGSLLIAVGAAWLGLLASGALAKVNWNQYKPTWWLAIEAQSTDPSTLPPILDELIARLDRGELSKARIGALATLAMETFSRDASDCPREWDVFMQHAWGFDHLDATTTLRYAQDLFQPEVFIQPATVDGNPAALVACRVRQKRRSGGSNFYLCALTRLTLDGASLPLPDHQPIIDNLSSESPHLLSSTLSLAPPGPHRIEVTVAWTFGTDLSNPAPHIPRESRLNWPADYSFSGDMVDPSVTLLEFVGDDETRRQVLEAISAEFYALRGPADLRLNGFGRVTILNQPVFMEAAMQVCASDGAILYSHDISAPGRRRRSGHLAGSIDFWPEFPDRTVNRVDITLTPRWFDYPRSNPKPIGAIRIWYGELRICDIPVRWFDDLDDPEMPPGIRAKMKH